MNKKIVTLISAAALAAIAVPAMAAPSLENGDRGFGFEYQHKLAVLNEQGIKATSIEEWGDNVLRAFVVTDNGHQVMKFFDKDTLAPLSN